MATDTTYSVFDEFLSPIVDALTPDVAEKLLAVRVSPQFQARIDELAAKANDGSLSAPEQAEYERIVEADDLLTIAKLKIRAAFERK